MGSGTVKDKDAKLVLLTQFSLLTVSAMVIGLCFKRYGNVFVSIAAAIIADV